MKMSSITYVRANGNQIIAERLYDDVYRLQVDGEDGTSEITCTLAGAAKFLAEKHIEDDPLCPPIIVSTYRSQLGGLQ